MNSYIVIDDSNAEKILIKAFDCPNCMLPDLILNTPDFRYSLMTDKYSDYRTNVLLYESRWKTGEIVSELQNEIRRRLRTSGSHLQAHSLSDVYAGIVL